MRELRPVVITPTRLHYVLVNDDAECGSIEVVATERGADVVWNPDDDSTTVHLKVEPR